MRVGRVLIILGALTLAVQILACSTSLKTNQGRNEEKILEQPDLEKAKQEQIMEEQERQQEEPGER